MPARPALLTLVAAMALTPAAARAQEIVIPPGGGEAPGSEFLKPPGSAADPYAPAVDWARVPPWRQTSFFGLRAQGKTFVYVVDCSGSMADADRLARAKRELRRAVGAMRFPQRFHVIFYNDAPLALPGGGPQSAEADSRERMSRWLERIQPDGGTDPRAAMAQALALKPDGIFLLSDGKFPEGAAASIAASNPGRIPVHCVDMSGGSADLKRIAKDSGGQYAARP